MAYDIQSTSMLIGSISGDDIKIIFNPKLEKLYTGDSIKIIDDDKQGIVAQVFEIENLDFTNITDDALKSQIAHFNNITSNDFSEDINSLHVANCKIKLSIIGNKWVNWRGNLPSMVDYVDTVAPTEIISHTIGTSPLNPIDLGIFSSHTPVPLKFEASMLEKTTLMVGDKAKEKANLLNILQSELINKSAKVLIIDPKGGYNNLKKAKVLEAGKNFKLSLLDYGIQTLGGLIAGQTEPNLRHRVEHLYIQLTNKALSMSKDFIPLSLLKNLLEKEINTPEGQKRAQELGNLRSRITAISKLGIFANTPDEICDIGVLFNNSNLITLDISSIPLFWQKVFIRNAIKDITSYDGCAFIFYEDVNKYIDQEIAIDLLYKTNNLGLNNIFITNYEDDIPSEMIKQTENFFLFSTDNLENNNKFYNNLKSDRVLLDKLLKRQPENTVLIHGEISNHYPIIVELHDSNLNSLKTKHFGSIKKYVSEYGEIIYSYKPLEGPALQEHMHYEMNEPLSEVEFDDIDIPDIPSDEEIEKFTGYSYAPVDIQQSAYIEKYQSISDEYEEELLRHHSDLEEDEEDQQITIQHVPLDHGPHHQMHKQQQMIPPHQQQMPQQYQQIAHQIPDDEFIPQHMQQQQQMMPPHQQQTQPQHKQVSHQIPDDEFIPQHMQQQQQMMPPHQQQTQPQHQQVSHQIPDDEFIPQHMQQQQQMMPPYQQQMPPQHQQVSHQIPDDEFIPQHMQQQQQMMPPQHQQISHHITDDEFIPKHMQQQQQMMPPHQQQTQPQHQQVSHHIPDDEFIPQHMQQQQQMMPPQHQQISHQIPDDEFIPQHMQQQQQIMPPHQQQTQPQHQQVSHHIPDNEFAPQQARPHSEFSQNIARGQVRPESIPNQVEDIPVYASPSLDTDFMEFQEGDKVHHERYGIGIINRIITTGDKKLCSIQFQEFGRRLLDPKRGLTKVD